MPADDAANLWLHCTVPQPWGSLLVFSVTAILTVLSGYLIVKVVDRVSQDESPRAHHLHTFRDLRLLGELLDKHADELTDGETEAFVSMRFDLTAYPADSDGGTRFRELTVKQRAWVASAYARIVPVYENLVSRGLVPRGTPTAESKALDAMLAKPKMLKPPPRRKDP